MGFGTDSFETSTEMPPVLSNGTETGQDKLFQVVSETVVFETINGTLKSCLRPGSVHGVRLVRILYCAI